VIDPRSKRSLAMLKPRSRKAKASFLHEGTQWIKDVTQGIWEMIFETLGT